MTLSLSKSVLADNIIGRHACLHTEFIHGGDIPFPTEHKLSRLTTPPIEYMLNGYDESALNGVNPDIKVYEQELKDIEFPVAIILCVDKIENSSQEYKDVGYADLETFLQDLENSIVT